MNGGTEVAAVVIVPIGEGTIHQRSEFLKRICLGTGSGFLVTLMHQAMMAASKNPHRASKGGMKEWREISESVDVGAAIAYLLLAPRVRCQGRPFRIDREITSLRFLKSGS